MPKDITYSRDALKALRRMPTSTARNILAKVEQYARSPESLANNVSTLKGMDGACRLRVGDWRVIFTEDAIVIAIIKIGSRGSVYEQA